MNIFRALSINVNPPSAHVSTFGVHSQNAVDVTFGHNGKARTIRMFITRDGFDGLRSLSTKARLAVTLANAALGGDEQAQRVFTDLGISARDLREAAMAEAVYGG